MRKLTRVLVWLYVFTVPWDVVAFPGVGTVSRLIGLLAIGAGGVTVLLRGRFRWPGRVFWWAVAFSGLATASAFWTVSENLTVERAWSYGQLVASLWLIQEYVRTTTHLRAMAVAWCLGNYVPLVSLLQNFSGGRDRALFGSIDGERYTSAGAMYFNANDMGLTLALGLPIAWVLTRDRNRWIRWAALGYLVAAPLGVLLTGSRGSLIAALVALAVIPLTMQVVSWRAYIMLGVLAVGAGLLAVRYVPESLWARFLTIETGAGTMSGRTAIWDAGFTVVFEHPVLGVGAGAYGPAILPFLHQARTAHNTFLSIAVEQGLIGLAIFILLLATCGATIWRLPQAERVLWGVTLLAWLVGVNSVGWETRKLTWLLIALVSVHPLWRPDLRAPSRTRPRLNPFRDRGQVPAVSAGAPTPVASPI
jgi:O-antigen ligase